MTVDKMKYRHPSPTPNSFRKQLTDLRKPSRGFIKVYEIDFALTRHDQKLIYIEYYEWRDAAAESRDMYVRGEITAKEALKIIDK